MHNLTIQLPDDVRENLEWLSQREHKSVDKLITDSLRRYLTLARLQSPALQHLMKAGSGLSDTEAMTLAVEETRLHRAGQ